MNPVGFEQIEITQKNDGDSTKDTKLIAVIQAIIISFNIILQSTI